MEPHYYNIELSWESERQGEISSHDFPHKLKVATPLPFDGGLTGIWSPEHLLTASVSSCYMTTFLAIAYNSKLEFISFSCSAKGKLEQVDGKYLMTHIDLFPKLQLHKESDRAKADRILQKSEKACLIANSIKSSVSLYPEITSQNEQ